ncbi:uncharacterized protein LOC112638072 [Camponotus floridanus]|uniref:uncharacterized protein LOC112638072 n=1 Tax=Camponotus floridanus TaxID=104421 RepID=UPI000DC69F98|nr:uncharacterized protein LOC112638072 [Camponotus floridanus]
MDKNNVKKITIFDRCAYKNCNNIKSENCKLFRFPQKTDERFDIWIRNCGNEKLLKWSPASIQKAGLCADHFNKEDFISCTKLHIRKNPIPWTPKETDITHFVKDNAEKITEEGKINENIIQENVNHSDNQDCIPMEVETHGDFQVNVEEINNNNTNEEVAKKKITTRKRCYPSGKELFYNFGNDFADDEWFNNENPLPLFLDNYSQKEVKANMIKRRVKTQKKSASEKVYKKDEFSEIEKLKKENLRLKKLLMEKKRKQKNMTYMLKQRNIAIQKNKNVCKHSLNEFLNGKKCLKPLARTMIKLQFHKRRKEYTKEERFSKTNVLLFRKWIFTDEKGWTKSPIRIFCQELDIRNRNSTRIL